MWKCGLVQLDQGVYLSSGKQKARLKVGIGLLATGLILQLLIEISRAREQSVIDGAYYRCVQSNGYSFGVGNPCGVVVSANPLGWILAFIGFFIVIGHLTGKIASDKGRDYSNVKLGQKDLIEDQKKCKYCAEYVKKDAVFCKHCKNSI